MVQYRILIVGNMVTRACNFSNCLANIGNECKIEDMSVWDLGLVDPENSVSKNFCPNPTMHQVVICAITAASNLISSNEMVRATQTATVVQAGLVNALQERQKFHPSPANIFDINQAQITLKSLKKESTYQFIRAASQIKPIISG